MSRLAKGPGSCLDPARVPASSSDGTNLKVRTPHGGNRQARSARTRRKTAWFLPIFTAPFGLYFKQLGLIYVLL